MLLKIAWRNLRAQPGKTLIIGILIALGIALLVVGNSLAASVTAGIRESYIENVTGDIILRGTAKENDEQVDFLQNFGALPMIESYPALRDYLSTQPAVESFTPVLHSLGELTIDEAEDISAFANLWGINPTEYFAVFPDTFTMTEGDFWADDETGIVLTDGFRDAIETIHEHRLEVGDSVKLTQFNITTGSKIREVVIRGFGSFNNDESELFLAYLTDPGTVRYLSGLTLVKDDNTSQTASVTVDEDAFFGTSDLFSDVDATTDTTTDYDSILGDTSRRDKFLTLDNNAWHFTVVRVAPGYNATTTLQALQNDIAERDTLSSEIQVKNWRWGARQTLGFVTAIQIAINVAIIIVAIVAIIIIMNTLVISVSERSAEIGTIRAIGGQKGFVRRLITSEVLLTTLLFGIVGMALGAAIIGVIHWLGVPANNTFLRLLFGGDTFRPSLSLSSLWISLLAVSIIGVVASLYPTSVALGISPARAMNK